MYSLSLLVLPPFYLSVKYSVYKREKYVMSDSVVIGFLNFMTGSPDSLTPGVGSHCFLSRQGID